VYLGLRGASGGILLMWDRSVVEIIEVCGEVCGSMCVPKCDGEI